MGLNSGENENETMPTLDHDGIGHSGDAVAQTGRPEYRVLCVTDDSHVVGVCEKLSLEGLDPRIVVSFVEAKAVLESGSGYITVIDCDMNQETLRRILGFLSSREPSRLLMVGSVSNPPQVSPWIDVPDYVDYAWKPVTTAELALRIKATILRAGGNLPEVRAIPEKRQPEAENRSAGQQERQIVTVFSAKGGVGKSTIAVNLAVGLSKFYGLKVLIVDTDLWFGDVGIRLNTNSTRSLFDLCSDDELDLTDFRKVVIRHESGIDVLQRPPDLVLVERVRIAAIIKLLATIREMYDYVIVDTESSLGELNLGILDIADQVLLVSTPEMSAIANTARLMTVVETLGLADKIAILLNRANCGVNVEHIEANARLTIAAKIVSAGPAMVKAVNLGTSLLIADPLQEQLVTRDLARIVAMVAARPMHVPERRNRGSGRRLAFRRLLFRKQ